MPLPPPREGGTRGNQWTWVRLGAVNVSSSQVQINLWGGGMGFRLDKLLLTRNPRRPQQRLADRAPSFIRATTPTWNEAQPFPYQSYVAQRALWRTARHRRTQWIGLRRVQCPLWRIQDAGCDKPQDDIFDDAQPIRAAKEAAKSFVRRMRARFDQVAFVEYSDTATISRELNCVWQRDSPPVDLWPGRLGRPGHGPGQRVDSGVSTIAPATGGYEGPPSDNQNDGSVHLCHRQHESRGLRPTSPKAWKRDRGPAADSAITMDGPLRRATSSS